MAGPGLLDRFQQADLYVVITEAFCAGRNSLDVLDECLRAGVQLIQFREKEYSDRQFFERARAFRERCAAAGALLIIDDRVDMALAVGADGVHLGQEDLPLAEARRIAPHLLTGSSTHSIAEARAAEAAGASYINIGPLFPTQTKDVPTGVVGLEAIATITREVSLPTTCMGGIKAENIAEALAAGAQRIAVVTAVTAAEDVYSAAHTLRQAILRHRS